MSGCGPAASAPCSNTTYAEPRVHSARINVAVDLEVDRFEEQAAEMAAGSFIRKPLLTFPPYEFAVSVFPNGVNLDRKGRLCIFVGRRDNCPSLVTCHCMIELFLPDWRALPGDDLSKATARDPLRLGPDATKGWEFKALQDLRRQGFLSDGTLRLRVTFSPEFQEAGLDEAPSSAKPPPLLLQPAAAALAARTKLLSVDLSQALTRSIATDVVLVAEGQEFAAHGGILASRSPVFEAMLAAGMAESERRRIEVSDLDIPTMTAFLRYVYTGSAEEDGDPIDSPVGKWFYGTRFYEVRELGKRLCFYETTEENGLIEGELTKTDGLAWFAQLSNKASIRLTLRYTQMYGDYRATDSEELNKTIATSPDAAVRAAERWGSLLRAADKYCVQGLVVYCEQEMQERLTVHNAATMLAIANETGSEALKNVVLNHITQNEERMREVQETAGFDDLDRELVAEISEVFFNPMGRRRRKRRQGEDSADREFQDGQDWDRLSNAQLRRACAERDLPTSGSRAAIACRLRAEEAHPEQGGAPSL